MGRRLGIPTDTKDGQETLTITDQIRGSDAVNFDPGLQPDAALIRRAEDQCCHGTLAQFAELVRQQLNCRAVVICILDPFAELFAPDIPGRDRSAAARADACALASDPAHVPLPALLQRAPALLADPLAAVDLGFQFYAGLPLRLASGERLGVLAAVDPERRRVPRNELATLTRLAGLVGNLADARLAMR